MTARKKPPPPPDPWPPPWARSIGFFVGMGLVIFEAVIEDSRHLFVYGVGFLMTGLPLARGVERALDFVAGLKK